jgi:hypothetical protein
MRSGHPKVFMKAVRSFIRSDVTLAVRRAPARFLMLLFALAASPSHASTVSVCDEASLTQALQGGGTISFACDGTIVLSGAIRVLADLTIDGTGRDVTLSGNNTNRLFIVEAGARLGLIGLTLANGRVTGTNVVVINGQDGESVSGGAILNNGGDLWISGCTFKDNAAIGGNANGGDPPGNGGAASGGAIYSLAGC